MVRVIRTRSPASYQPKGADDERTQQEASIGNCLGPRRLGVMRTGSLIAHDAAANLLRARRGVPMGEVRAAVSPRGLSVPERDH
ncbi:MAG: hypothetical protein QN178_01685 [Armatimonadota bacterium]|nr:hypothetical protein [Armatimonadota bacterium]